MRLFDLGGSGVKTVQVEGSFPVDSLRRARIQYFPQPDWARFIQWANNSGLIDDNVFGVSCAGFIEKEGTVSLFRVGGWKDRRLVDDLCRARPGCKAFLLNDAEAHLVAHFGLYDDPQMCISLGTSPGFAISNRNGEIVRTLVDINFDIGTLRLPTSAKNSQVWWALGSNGLTSLTKELGRRGGMKRYGYRLGGFMASLCSIFRPKTLVFSGGITEDGWEDFSNTMISEFDAECPGWLDRPRIVKSPYPREAALVGVAKYAASRAKG